MRIKLIKYIVAVAALSAAGGSYASIPEYFVQQWYPGVLPTGWEAEGSGKTPSGATAEMLGGSDSWQIVEFPYGDIYVASGSTTSEGGKVKTTLYSPSISIPEGGAVLSVDLVNYNPEGQFDNKLTVYAIDSETGENYIPELISTRVKANNYGNPSHMAVALEGLEGSNVRFAFVNEGNDAGLLGIGEVKVAMYDGSITDLTRMFSTIVTDREIDASISVCSKADRIKATLTAPGIEEIIYVETPSDNGYASYPLPFTSKLRAEKDQSIRYTISVVPDFENAVAIEMVGNVACSDGFNSVVVEEEATGERCGYCPLGAAGISRYADLYPDRYIGIAIHCTQSFSTGVMEAKSYADPFVTNSRFPIESLPTAIINRKEQISPTNLAALDKTVAAMLSSRSIAKVDIKRVDCDFYTGETKVTFNATSATDLESADFSAAVVVTADGLTGTSAAWIQHNYYSGSRRPEEMTDEWWEYARFYYEYPSSQISSADKAFDHVAMGIYPDYNGSGCRMPSDWLSNEPHEGEIEFTMPLQTEKNGFGIQDLNRTAVVVLLFDSRNGEIIGASKVEAKDFNRDISGIDLTSSGSNVNHNGEYYTLQGIKVDPMNCPNGIYICRKGSNVTKIMISNNR